MAMGESQSVERNASTILVRDRTPNQRETHGNAVIKSESTFPVLAQELRQRLLPVVWSDGAPIQREPRNQRIRMHALQKLVVRKNDAGAQGRVALRHLTPRALEEFGVKIFAQFANILQDVSTGSRCAQRGQHHAFL